MFLFGLAGSYLTIFEVVFVDDSSVSSSEVTTVSEMDSASAPEASSNTGTVASVGATDRPIMTTSLDDYSVTEGLLLCILLVLAARGLVWLADRIFDL